MEIKHLSAYKVGSNQYKKHIKHNLKAKTWASIVIVILVILILEIPLFTSAGLEKRLSKLSGSFHAYASEVNEYQPNKDLLASKSNVIAFINEVFGSYADEAILIANCESGINPKAIGTNKNGSQDFGLFQLNSEWHGFSKGINNNRHLLDYRINTLMAWNIFKGSGYNWSLWVCSEKVGLN